MNNPTFEKLKSAKRILGYIKGTLDLGLKYKHGENFVGVSYSDSHYGGDSEVGR